MSAVNNLLESYLEKVVPKDASKIQIKETRRAFIAGLVSCRQLYLSIAKIPNMEVAETTMVKYDREIDELLKKEVEVGKTVRERV